MIGHTEYSVIIHEKEIGFQVAELMHDLRQSGRVDSIGDGSYQVKCASEMERKHVMESIEKLWETDFPNDCDYCGNQPEECDCEPDPNPTDNRAAQ